MGREPIDSLPIGLRRKAFPEISWCRNSIDSEPSACPISGASMNAKRNGTRSTHSPRRGFQTLARKPSPSKTFCTFASSVSDMRSEEHTSELQSLMRISYAVFCLKKKKQQLTNTTTHN